MIFSEYPDREMMMLGLANILAGELADFTRREGRASFCVPGGTTPGPIFDTLSGVDLEWDKIAVFLNDERWVPDTNPRSNTALIRQRLIRGRAANANLIPLFADTAQPEDSLDILSDGIA
ncbi:MAG: 6-phosphogluconolactonase, partial [Rhodoferax sp.]|nr:6-phosphogluconolactonase [Pseudorhodobacter sp.]